jgi:hypothetical protein
MLGQFTLSLNARSIFLRSTSVLARKRRPFLRTEVDNVTTEKESIKTSSISD